MSNLRRVQSLPVQRAPPPPSPAEDVEPVLQEGNSLEPFFSIELDPEDALPSCPEQASKAATQAAFDRSFSDLAKYKEDLQHCDTPLHKILQLCCPTSDVCGQLNRHLQVLKPQCMEAGRVNVQRVAEKLQALGYVVQLWVDAADRREGRNALRNLRHDFVVCLGARGSDGSTTTFAAPVIVEPMFKQQFHTRHTTDEFATLVKAIPTTFVGPLDKLRAIVSLVAAEMSRAFRATGFDLPPWRSHQALLSLWRPDRLEQLAASLARDGISAASPRVARNGVATGGSPRAARDGAADGPPRQAARAASPPSRPAQPPSAPRPGSTSAPASPPPRPARPPGAPQAGSTSAPASPAAPASQPTPFAAYAVSPFAAVAASADGGGSSDTAPPHTDKPNSRPPSSRPPKVQPPTQAVPVPPRRTDKPVSMLAAALNNSRQQGQCQDENSPADTADQFWTSYATVRRQR